MPKVGLRLGNLSRGGSGLRSIPMGREVGFFCTLANQGRS